MDVVSKQVRSRMMSGIRGKDTKPELYIRSQLHRLGFRFRIHYKKLPGQPDIALPKYRALILIHGCFWHGHGCHLFKWPKGNADFWQKKIRGNIRRDAEHRYHYSSLGWRTLVVWECAVKGKYRIEPEFLLDQTKQWILTGVGDKSLTGSDSMEVNT